MGGIRCPFDGSRGQEGGDFNHEGDPMKALACSPCRDLPNGSFVRERLAALLSRGMFLRQRRADLRMEMTDNEFLVEATRPDCADLRGQDRA